VVIKSNSLVGTIGNPLVGFRKIPFLGTVENPLMRTVFKMIQNGFQENPQFWNDGTRDLSTSERVFSNTKTHSKAVVNLISNDVSHDSKSVSFEILHISSNACYKLYIMLCGHVTYQIWAWFETFKGNVN